MRTIERKQTGRKASTTKPTTGRTRVDLEFDPGILKQAERLAKKQGLTLDLLADKALAAITEKHCDKATTAAVSLRVSAKVERMLKQHGITAEKLINDIWTSMSGTESIAEILQTVYPVNGNRGYINGLFLIEG